MKTQEGAGAASGVWALRITSDMAGVDFTAGVKRRRILRAATGNMWCGLIMLFDLERIEPVAIMPDGVIQKVRVAALSTVGAKYLAPQRPKVLGLFGSGWQAGAHLEMLCSRFEFERIKVYSPNPESRCEFARTMTAKLKRPIEPVNSPKECVEGSDFVQAATAAWEPVFDGHLVQPGMYIARSAAPTRAINGAKSTTSASAAPTFTWSTRRKLLRTTNHRTFGKRPGRASPWDDIAEIQDLVAGKVKGRTSPEQITVFNNNTGAGTQFAAVGSAVLKRAKAMGLGRELPVEWFLEDVSP